MSGSLTDGTAGFFGGTPLNAGVATASASAAAAALSATLAAASAAKAALSATTAATAAAGVTTSALTASTAATAAAASATSAAAVSASVGTSVTAAGTSATNAGNSASAAAASAAAAAASATASAASATTSTSNATASGTSSATAGNSATAAGISATNASNSAAQAAASAASAGSVNFAAPPAIGNTTPNTGAFTTLTATGNPKFADPVAASNDGSAVTTRYLTTTLAGTSSGAPLNSPAFTGVPTVPLAAFATSNAQIASTLFVQQTIANPVITGGQINGPVFINTSSQAYFLALGSFYGRSSGKTLTSAFPADSLTFTTNLAGTGESDVIMSSTGGTGVGGLSFWQTASTGVLTTTAPVVSIGPTGALMASTIQFGSSSGPTEAVGNAVPLATTIDGVTGHAAGTPASGSKFTNPTGAAGARRYDFFGGAWLPRATP